MGGLLQPGPTLAQAEELRAKRGSRGLLEAIGTPLSYAPLAPVAAIGQGLLGARYLTGEAEPMQGMASLSDMTAMMVGSRVPAFAKSAKVLRLYRGVNPSSNERISTGRPGWDDNLFAAKTREQARQYGESIQELTLDPAARVLREGTDGFRKVVGQMRKGENLLDYAERSVASAKAAGYDVVDFDKWKDLGVAVINRAVIK